MVSGTTSQNVVCKVRIGTGRTFWSWWLQLLENGSYWDKKKFEFVVSFFFSVY